MAELAYPYAGTTAPSPGARKSLLEFVSEWLQMLPILVVAALLADLLTPFLIWKRFLPGAAKWLGDLFILMMIGHAIWCMLQRDRIPSAFLLMIAVSIVGSVVASFEGQQWQATAWGIWLLFKYPIVGVYTYIYSNWPSDFPTKFFYLLMGLLAFETAFQIGQFLTGTPTGDDLAGSFGWHGIASLTMFSTIVLCVAFGHWLATGRWWALVLGVAFCGIASVLGEIKVFPIVVVAIASISVVLLIVRNGKVGQALAILVILACLAPLFAVMYNTFVAEANGTRRIEEYFDAATTEKYLQNTDLLPSGIYYFGRGFAMEYAWNAIQRDRTTLAFGYGIGARADSKALGILGQALVQSDYGRTTPGTSMLILLQEIGVVGLAILGVFVLYFSYSMYLDVGRNPDTYLSSIRYGFLLFSALWPLWLWYTSSWHSAVTMILYWAGVGYLLSHREAPIVNTPAYEEWVRSWKDEPPIAVEVL